MFLSVKVICPEILWSVINISENQAIFQTFINSIVHYANDASDPATEKLAFMVINKMIAAWCTSTIQNGTYLHTPLAGFDDFLYRSLLPLCFEVPAKSTFNVQDAQSIQVLGEIASVQKVILRIKGQSFITYLTDVYFRSVNLPSDRVQQYTQALQTLDTKKFKKFFHVGCLGRDSMLTVS